MNKSIKMTAVSAMIVSLAVLVAGTAQADCYLGPNNVCYPTQAAKDNARAAWYATAEQQHASDWNTWIAVQRAEWAGANSLQMAVLEAADAQAVQAAQSEAAVQAIQAVKDKQAQAVGQATAGVQTMVQSIQARHAAEARLHARWVNSLAGRDGEETFQTSLEQAIAMQIQQQNDAYNKNLLRQLQFNPNPLTSKSSLVKLLL